MKTALQIGWLVLASVLLLTLWGWKENGRYSVKLRHEGPVRILILDTRTGVAKYPGGLDGRVFVFDFREGTFVAEESHK